MTALFGYVAGAMAALDERRTPYRRGLMGLRCRQAAVEKVQVARRARRRQIIELAFARHDPVLSPTLERAQ